MSPVECAAWVGGTWLAIAIVAAWIKHRLRRPPLPQRTPADVHRDVDTYRAGRIAEIEARANGIPAAADNAEGVNRGDWDDCELILAATNDIEAGLQRLRDALRKEGQQ